METYTTEEGIVHCSSCGTALSKSEVETENCSHCWQVENEVEDMDYDDDDFQECDGCDGHDACRDFGCAIKAGLGHLVQQPL